MVPVTSSQVTDWRESGDPRQLSRVTIRESAYVDAGDWRLDQITQWRVWYPDRWELYRDGDAGKVIVDGGTNPLGIVPLVTLYFNRLDFMFAYPVLERLAWLELAHWQSRSDQSNILSVARCPGIVFSGFDLARGDLEWGPNRAYKAENPQASVKFVEHGGKAVESGRQDLLDIEARMRSVTAASLTAAPGDVKATAMAIDTASARTWVQAMAMATERALEQAFMLALAWVNQSGGKVDLTVNSEFGLPNEQDDLDEIVKARQMGDLSLPTFLEEMQRRGTLDDRLDLAKEVKQIESETEQLDFADEAETLRMELDAMRTGVDVGGVPVEEAA